MSEHVIAAVTKTLSPNAAGFVYCGQGAVVEEFETKFQTWLDVPVKPLTTNSCTSAITLALRTLKIGPGDYVVASPQTCLASNSPILDRGASVVWADIDRQTCLINMEDAIAKAKQYNAKAIIAVDWGGLNSVNVPQIERPCPIIQDVAHGLRIAKDPALRGDWVAWSFGPIKHLCFGDGGALLTPESYYKQAKLLRWYGIDRESQDNFRCNANVADLGAKYHCNDINASIGLSNFELAIKNIEIAKQNAKRYSAHLIHDDIILPPATLNGLDNSHWLYSIIYKGNRDNLMHYLKLKGIDCSPVHAANHRHSCFNGHAFEYDLPAANYVDQHQLSIPVGWWLTDDNITYIIESILSYVNSEKII